MLLKELREKVYHYCKALPAYELGHGSQGNISALDPETGLIAIKPSAINYDVMKPEDIVVVDKFGNHVEGKWKSTSETHMHTIFYPNRLDVGAVIHTHAPYATIFGVILRTHPPHPDRSLHRLKGMVAQAEEEGYQQDYSCTYKRQADV
jgi:L-ribulose-5-phosphate 4-epimerase